MKNVHKLIVVAIILMGFWVRLYRLTTPLGDWHSWRQADTASVSREYVKHGIDLLHPKYLDISPIPSGKDNPHGYRMVEFPLVAAGVALIYTATDSFLEVPIHVVYRMVNSVFSLISALLVYLIVKEKADQLTALIAMGIFTFLPFNVFYSRAVLPEVSLVTFSLLAIYSWLMYLKTKKTYLLPVFWLSTAVSFLIKPTAIFFFLPLIPGTPITLLHLGVATTSVLPFAAWRVWISQYKEGIPAFTWLLNGNGIRFKGAFFYWIFGDRIGKRIVGYWGLVLLGFGFMAKIKTNFFLLWLLSMVLYVVVFATGNVQHDYYQVVLIPIISCYLAIGSVHLLHQKTFKAYSLLGLSYVLMFSLSWYEVRDYFNINNPAMVAAGQAVDRLTPPDALIIAPYQGDTAFLYQTNRRGWPVGEGIDIKMSQGATYYVTTANTPEAKILAKVYTVIEKTPEYILIHLVKP